MGEAAARDAEEATVGAGAETLSMAGKGWEEPGGAARAAGAARAVAPVEGVSGKEMLWQSCFLAQAEGSAAPAVAAESPEAEAEVVVAVSQDRKLANTAGPGRYGATANAEGATPLGMAVAMEGSEEKAPEAATATEKAAVATVASSAQEAAAARTDSHPRHTRRSPPEASPSALTPRVRRC